MPKHLHTKGSYMGLLMSSLSLIFTFQMICRGDGGGDTITIGKASKSDRLIKNRCFA